MTVSEYYEECLYLLHTVYNIETVDIGIERGIGTKDSPFIRVLPISNKNNGNDIDISFNIVFGFDRTSKEMIDLYNSFFNLENEIKKALKTVAIWEQTETDKDEVPNLKVAVMKFKGIECVQ